MRLISRVTLDLFNTKAAVSEPSLRGGASVGQLLHYLFCFRQIKSLKTRRKEASTTLGIARGLLPERSCSPATCCSIVSRCTQGLRIPWIAETQVQTPIAFHTTQNQQQTSSSPPFKPTPCVLGVFLFIAHLKSHLCL